MSNRETFPANLSPLTGDVLAIAGARQVTVTGLQGTPVSSATPSDQNVLVFDAASSQWKPQASGGTAILVNGVPTSDDYDVYVNAGNLVKVNGV